MGMNDTRETQRGFAIAEFTDANDVECSLQKSSIAGTDMIWLGCSGANPKLLVQDKGWLPYPLPDAVSVTTRMHLTQEQVADLLPALQHFVDTGELPPQEGTELTAAYQWVRDHPAVAFMDHACAQCREGYQDSPLVIDGFVCVPHRANEAKADG